MLGEPLEEATVLGGPRIKLGEPWSQLGGPQCQLGGPQSQLAGPHNQLRGPGGGQTDGQNFSPFYSTSSPTGASAQKPSPDLTHGPRP